MAGRTFPFAVRAVAFLLCAALADACGGSQPPPPPVHILVDQAPHDVKNGTTFGALVGALHLHASTGRLLSVGGTVLSHFAEPGRILLNGKRRAPTTTLANGDVIRVVDGADRTEGVRRTVANIGRQVGNPERTLDTYPTKQVTVAGRMSGEIVSVTDVSKGPGMAPNSVALTFDDGPWPVDTERVLAVLKRFGVPATFFMVGNLVQRYPDLVQEVERDGQQVENHSFDHPVSPPLADLTEHRITSEITDTNAALERNGVRPTLFRPPGGSYDDYVIQQARNLGMRVVLWSIDPKDWQSSRTAKQVTRSVLSSVQPGSIILLHDGGGDASHTIKALPAIIRGIRKKGLRFAFVPARAQ